MAPPPRVRRVQEIRRSSATTPIPSGKIYRRRPKHRDRPTPRPSRQQEDTDR